MDKDKRNLLIETLNALVSEFAMSDQSGRTRALRDTISYIDELETRIANSIPGRQPFTGDVYLDTVARLEPEVAAIDPGAFYASTAISLKRIADALTKNIASADKTDISVLDVYNVHKEMMKEYYSAIEASKHVAVLGLTTAGEGYNWGYAQALLKYSNKLAPLLGLSTIKQQI